MHYEWDVSFQKRAGDSVARAVRQLDVHYGEIWRVTAEKPIGLLARPRHYHRKAGLCQMRFYVENDQHFVFEDESYRRFQCKSPTRDDATRGF